MIQRQVDSCDTVSIDITGKPNAYVFWRISKKIIGKNNDFSRHDATYLNRNGRGTVSIQDLII